MHTPSSGWSLIDVRQSPLPGNACLCFRKQTGSSKFAVGLSARGCSTAHSKASASAFNAQSAKHLLRVLVLFRFRGLLVAI